MCSVISLTRGRPNSVASDHMTSFTMFPKLSGRLKDFAFVIAE